MTETNAPLVSFVIIAWRQEPFIRAAVEGAFQQTYSPLEIILSDDCSPDGTFDIMREMAESYRGPHQVRLNHNERNLGLGGHVNRCMELVRGELVVVAAGDDISVPRRTETLVKAWLDSGQGALDLLGYRSDGPTRRQARHQPFSARAVAARSAAFVPDRKSRGAGLHSRLGKIGV